MTKKEKKIYDEKIEYINLLNLEEPTKKELKRMSVLEKKLPSSFIDNPEITEEDEISQEDQVKNKKNKIDNKKNETVKTQLEVSDIEIVENNVTAPLIQKVPSNYLGLILPKFLEEGNDSTGNFQYISHDDQYTVMLYIKALPEMLDIHTFSALFDTKPFENVHKKVSITTQTIEKRERKEDLMSKKKKIEAEMILANKREKTSNIEYENLKKELADIQQRIKDYDASSVQLSVLVSLTSSNLEVLKDTVKKYKQEFMIYDITLQEAFFNQLETFFEHSTLFKSPTLKSLSHKMEVDCDVVAPLFPFRYSPTLEENGVYLGKSQLNIPFVSSNMSKLATSNKENKNTLIIGDVGSGKTYFGQFILMTSLAQGFRNLIIDAEGQFSELTKYVGGIDIEFHPEKPIGLNIFDIKKLDINELRSAEEKEKERLKIEMGNNVNSEALDEVSYFDGLKTKIERVNKIICNLIQVVHGVNKLPPGVENFINNNIIELYANFGFNSDEDLSKIGQDESNIQKMPKMSDFIELIEKNTKIHYMEFKKDPSYNLKLNLKYGYEITDIRYVMTSVQKFKTNGPLSFLDCYTDYSNPLFTWKEVPMINFNLSSYISAESTDTTSLLAIFQVILEFLNNEFLNGTQDIPKRLVIDELYKYVGPTQSLSPYLAKTFESIARTSRKRYCYFYGLTQHLMEFNSPSGEAIIQQMSNFFLMGVSRNKVSEQILEKNIGLSHETIEKHFALSDKKNDESLKNTVRGHYDLVINSTRTERLIASAPDHLHTIIESSLAKKQIDSRK